MELLERGEKQQTVTRLAVCVALALAVYFGGEKLCAAAKLPLWEKYRPWLEQNKIQAIAIVAAAIFGISLVLFPLKREPEPAPEVCPPDDGFVPCQ